ncbi:MAG TPA: hypothetical protein VJ927_11635 [Actinomycetota bacterium]|nr:hypothetical protein [Actinomycetota bacterium]
MPLVARRLAPALVAVVVLIASLLAPSRAGAAGDAESSPIPAPFLVGAATALANPELGTCLGGYDTFCSRNVKDIRDDLTTAAFAITGRNDGEANTVVIVKTTAVGLFASYKPEQGRTGIYDVRQRIAEETGIPADQVIVTSDHSHAAPDTIGIWGGVSRSYMEKLARSIVDAAVEAYGKRQPAHLSVAAVQGPALDSSYDLGPTDDAAMDEEFRVLFAKAPDGSPIATLVNYAPHATVCGECDDRASGDWTAWAAQEISERGLGIGIGFVGALGATDWNKPSGSSDVKAAAARARINTLLDAALANPQPVTGDEVAADVVFIREKLAQPILAANYVPSGTLRCPFPPGMHEEQPCDGSEIRIDRDTRPPWLTGSVLGTYFGAVRIGDVFFSTMPGEPFPQLQDALRDTVTGASKHFLLGAANDFLGYMVADDEQYQQSLEEGATYLGGCPEQELQDGAGMPHDGACPDHWTLMVSPTIGRHGVCTIQDAAERLGFGVTERSDRCGALTALDGQQAPEEHPGGGARAGVAVVEAPWHIGASGGQFGDDGAPFSEDAVDPHHHNTKKVSAYGMGSNVTVRALVVEDAAGEKVAIVSHDLYLPQDLLTRRIGTLVERATNGEITSDHVVVTASHNHNTAFYSTPGWGTWIFQDVYDLRFFEYMAERAAQAVSKADQGLVPVRMGGATSTFNEITSHTYGPALADDGTPAGQPYEHTTGELTVVAFDDMSDPAAPKPLATWVVFGVHPEWTWGYDLLNGDISAATSRIVDRELGGVTVWSGREIGSSGPHKDTRVHEPEERREYQDNGFGQLDRAARMLATAIGDTRSDIAAETPEIESRFAPFDEHFDVAAASQRFAPPTTRPVPGVSNCNTASLFHGDPRIPVLGLPDCAHANDPPDEPTGAFGPLDDAADAIGGVVKEAGEVYGPIGAELYDQLKEAGVPIPDSYSATKLTAVEETAAVHLMAVKLGDIGITVCPCEQFTDTALNIQSRIDRVANNLWVGFDWTKTKTPAGRDFCTPNGDGTWTCADPRNPSSDLPPIDDHAYQRMRAQINNDAAGWEIDDGVDPESDVRTLGAESEPWDPVEIKGNFTHEEFPDHGFKLPIAIGMGNDYWGYVPEYREMRTHDHYRKALNGLGPHGADFLATRLSRLAVSMNGGPGVALRPLDLAYQAESARALAMANVLGELADAYEQAYRAQLPSDGGEAGILSAPEKITRFSGGHVTWIGGSTYADMPSVVVERKTDAEEWMPYATTDGDIELTVKMPRPEELPEWRAGEFVWRWTAAFEAFGSDVTLPDASGEPRTTTPAGEYRFVIKGQRRIGPGDELSEYTLTHPFKVAPWDGITVSDLQVGDNTVSFDVGSSVEACPGKQGQSELGEPGDIDLPDSYDSPFRYIECEWRVYKYGRAESEWQSYCSFCSFRPWADTSDIVEATVTIVRENGDVEKVSATERDGRWVADAEVFQGDRAFVEAGEVRDEFGNVNGDRSGEGQGTKPRPTPTPSEDPSPTPTEDPSPTPTETDDPDPLPTVTVLPTPTETEAEPSPTPTVTPTSTASPTSRPTTTPGGGGGGGSGGGPGSGGGGPSPSPSETQPAPRRASSVAFTSESAESGQYSDRARLEAQITDDSGAPLAGRRVVFELRGPDTVWTFESQTDAAGIATVAALLAGEPGQHVLTARFDGDREHTGSADVSAFVVEKEDTLLRLTARDRKLRAKLVDEDTRDRAIAGRRIRFFADDRLLRSRRTNANGIARYRVAKATWESSRRLRAVFGGDRYYLDARDAIR